MAFRLDAESRRRLDELAEARAHGHKGARGIVLRDAVKEYLALYVIGAEPTIGRLHTRLEDVEQRLATLERLLMEKGAKKR